jgi:predicted kinase
MIEVLVGVTASGKSAYAAKRAAAGALVLDYDALLLMLHGGRYEHRPDLTGLYEDIMLATLRSAVARGRDAVLDGCHLTRDSRAYWVKIARALGVPCAAVVFSVAARPAAVAASIHAYWRVRADPRGKTAAEWAEVARRQCERLAAEPVAAAEGFDQVLEVRP